MACGRRYITAADVASLSEFNETEHKTSTNLRGDSSDIGIFLHDESDRAAHSNGHEGLGYLYRHRHRMDLFRHRICKFTQRNLFRVIWRNDACGGIFKFLGELAGSFYDLLFWDERRIARYRFFAAFCDMVCQPAFFEG